MSKLLSQNVTLKCLLTTSNKGSAGKDFQILEIALFKLGP